MAFVHVYACLFTQNQLSYLWGSDGLSPGKLHKMRRRSKMKLFHVYVSGRFGPEKHFGFVIAKSANCLLFSTYVCFDIVKSTVIPVGFFTNPKAIGNLNDYRKWKRSQTSEVKNECRFSR